ncbi:MAG: glycosyltransferase, partial [Schaedlerella sp.]|uniref:glycosyltransferase family protein n=1 Tax=Schaedlerella sp. TaxID=2676057 RepID=UPI003527A7E6
HKTFILDLKNPPAENPHSFAKFSAFIAEKVDAAICFDGLGTREDIFIDIWNVYQTVVIDILMDPPLRFHPSLEKHPQNYLLFCCDLDHVEYVKKYFSQTVSHVDFMPHVGIIPNKTIPDIPYREKKYDILFSGTYYRPETMFTKIEEMFGKGTDTYHFYLDVFECLVNDSSFTIEQAIIHNIENLNVGIDQNNLKLLLGCSESIDWAIRMYQRDRVIKTLADTGLELHLLGRGWENHSSAGCPNVHRIDDRIPYAETLAYMADARINLNVFPWFKAGTHDRIFNALLQHSLPLTDPSRWITENFTDGEDIALYDLKHLEQLPEIAGEFLREADRAEAMIKRGYEKVIRNFTWSHCADWILNAIHTII